MKNATMAKRGFLVVPVVLVVRFACCFLCPVLPAFGELAVGSQN